CQLGSQFTQGDIPLFLFANSCPFFRFSPYSLGLRKLLFLLLPLSFSFQCFLSLSFLLPPLFFLLLLSKSSYPLILLPLNFFQCLIPPRIKFIFLLRLNAFPIRLIIR